MMRAEIMLDVVIALIAGLAYYAVLRSDYAVHGRLRWRIVIGAALFAVATLILFAVWIDALAHLACLEC